MREIQELYTKDPSARPCRSMLPCAMLRTQEALVDCLRLRRVDAMAIDATFAPKRVATRPVNHVEVISSLCLALVGSSTKLGGCCTPSVWQSTLCLHVHNGVASRRGAISTQFHLLLLVRQETTFTSFYVAKVLSLAWKFLGLLLISAGQTAQLSMHRLHKHSSDYFILFFEV